MIERLSIWFADDNLALTCIALPLCIVAHLCTTSPISERLSVLSVRCSNNYLFVDGEAVSQSAYFAASRTSKVENMSHGENSFANSNTTKKQKCTCLFIYFL